MKMNSHVENEEAKQAEQKMLGAIRKGEVEMKPRWHFALRTALFVTGGVLAILALLYLASFIVFALQLNGTWFAPIFGFAGWYTFFGSIPWILVIFLLLFLVILAVLVKRYAFVYEHPSLYFFVGIMAIIALGGFLIAQTPFHRKLFDAARSGNLPVLGGFYREFGMQHAKGIHRGTIVGTTTNGFIIQDINGQTSTVPFNGFTHFPPGGPRAGGDFVIFGPRNQSGTITAQGIEPLGP